MARLLLTLFVLIHLGVGCGSSPPGRLIVEDELKTLDRPRLELAADPFLREGAQVYVGAVSEGGPRDLSTRLARLNLLERSQVRSQVVVLYFTLSPRFSEIRVGSRYSEYLPPGALEVQRERSFNPLLRAGRTSEAIASTLTACWSEIEAARRLRHQVGLGLLALVPLAALAKILQAFYYRHYQSWPAKRFRRVLEATPWARARSRRSHATQRHQISQRLAEVQGHLTQALSDERQQFGQHQRQEWRELTVSFCSAEGLSDDRLVALYDEAQRTERELLSYLRVHSIMLSRQEQVRRLLTEFGRTQTSRKARRLAKKDPHREDKERQRVALEDRYQAILDHWKAAVGAPAYLAATANQAIQELELLESEVRKCWAQLSPATYPTPSKTFDDPSHHSSAPSEPSRQTSTEVPDCNHGWTSNDGESRAAGEW